MDVSPAQPRAPWSFRILVVLLWVSLVPQLFSLVEQTDRYLEQPGYFLRRGLVIVIMVLLRVWLNWQFGRRRRWARLALLWFHLVVACVCAYGVWSLRDGSIVFYPYWWAYMLLTIIGVCLFFSYLLVRKDVAAWCRQDAPVSATPSV